MRDIKFRAWDEENKQMIQWHDTFFYDTSAVTNWSGDFSYIEMPLMQFTGLKDSNGKEIYEGDIVEYQDSICDGYREYPITRKREVSYGIGVFWAGSYELHKVRNEAVIIGNIYESPELITK
jgi:uncharacterized phage protein (TIGR01671 family)